MNNILKRITNKKENPNTHKVYIGIDAGKTGAITILRSGLVEFHKMPLIKNKQGETSLDVERILDIISPADYIALEQQFILPQQGNKSNFTIGFNCGILLALCKVTGAKVYTPHPKKWQKFYPSLLRYKGNRVGRKKEVMRLASKMSNQEIKHDGIGDSCLIAFYAKKITELKEM